MSIIKTDNLLLGNLFFVDEAKQQSMLTQNGCPYWPHVPLQTCVLVLVGQTVQMCVDSILISIGQDV